MSGGCSHRGEAIRVGPYTILVGGTSYLRPADLAKADILIPLEPKVPARCGQLVSMLVYPWRDMEPPPAGFKEFLLEEVVPLLQQGKKLLVYCIGGHGRTGTFLASLIALIESREETPDPIAAVRERHCRNAVETVGQAAAIFALRGESLPKMYL